MLLLLFGLFFFCSSDVLAMEKLSIDVLFSNCDGNKPSEHRSVVLWPHAFYLVVTDPATNVVQDVFYFHIRGNLEKGIWDFFEDYELKTPLKYKNPSDVKVLLYVKTAMDEKMTGIDHQIYYGQPAFVDFSNFTGKPLKELGDSPFRISTVRVIHTVNSKKITLFNAGNGYCHYLIPYAWIANHGLYRVCKATMAEDKNVIPVFESIYYMPRTGMYLDPKCVHE